MKTKLQLGKIPLRQKKLPALTSVCLHKEVLVNGQPIVQATPITCFFTSQYADVTQIDLEEFLRYCPIGSVLTDNDAQEFQAVMAKEKPNFQDETALPSGYPVPVHRFKREDVSALLKTYANITVEDLQNTEGVIYLEEYDAFYNFTSDFGPGTFNCAGGQTLANGVRLWTGLRQSGARGVLTLQKAGERYFIQSYEWEETAQLPYALCKGIAILLGESPRISSPL